ncbi:hypothetical protein QBC41DRAFT_222569 [Cercophora samala]|uniref:Uncharacterized protein n=1 Tax=Cercophora samala TaxID=330535 RepID=A0AA39ZFJ3_9PEZI|nr:hypothetical protein QBC41DRAFT_222569 [Cercophora samala]
MPGPAKLTNRWEDIKDDLFEIIYNLNAPLSAEQKDAVVKAMRDRGYNIGWNGLRYYLYFTLPFLCLFLFFLSSANGQTIITTTVRPRPHHHRPATPAMARKLTNWGEQEHLAVLLSMYQVMQPTKLDMTNIAEACRARGFLFTPGALTVFTAFPRTLSRSLTPYIPDPQQLLSTSIDNSNMPPARVPSGKPTTVWDHDAHLTLLQALVVCGEIKADRWDDIIAYVNHRGYKYTPGAALHLSCKVADMADKTRMKWDLQANHDLLFCLIQELSPTQDQLRGVMDRMHIIGHTCTLKAITQHLQKLRRKDNTANNDGAEGSGTGDNTPAKGRKAATKKATTPAKRKARAATADDDTDDEEPESPTPAKKRRVVKKEVKSEPHVKKEESEDDDTDPYGQPRAADAVYDPHSA